MKIDELFEIVGALEAKGTIADLSEARKQLFENAHLFEAEESQRISEAEARIQSLIFEQLDIDLSDDDLEGFTLIDPASGKVVSGN